MKLLIAVRLAIAGVAILVAGVLSGCETTNAHAPAEQVVPTGNTAKVVDWGDNFTEGRGELYVLRAIDGQSIPTAIEATRRATYGRGPNLAVVGAERLVAARPMKVTLLATHVSATPLGALIGPALGVSFSVEGAVDFNPQAGVEYVVKGSLSKALSQVWIEEVRTGRRVTEVVTKAGGT